MSATDPYLASRLKNKWSSESSATIHLHVVDRDNFTSIQTVSVMLQTRRQTFGLINIGFLKIGRSG
jgi:uncharacterized protein YbbC (DUF1343 family)